METVTTDAPSLTLFLSKSSLLDRATLNQLFTNLQESLFNELGIICPIVSIQDSEEMSQNWFQLQINDRRLDPTSGLKFDEFLVNYPSSKTTEIGVASRPALNPLWENEASIVQGGNEARLKCEQAGYEIVNPVDYIFLSVAATVRKNAGLLLSVELVEHFLATLEEFYPDLINAVRTHVDISTLTETLRAKLKRNSSIKNMPPILEDLLSQAV
jgi:type III secretory pathway component EscV